MLITTERVIYLLEKQLEIIKRTPHKHIVSFLNVFITRINKSYSWQFYL